jgi:hypothetical protein
VSDSHKPQARDERPGWCEYHPASGAFIFDAAKDLLSVAVARGARVRMEFNGVKTWADPDDSVKGICERWQRACPKPTEPDHYPLCEAACAVADAWVNEPRFPETLTREQMSEELAAALDRVEVLTRWSRMRKVRP